MIATNNRKLATIFSGLRMRKTKKIIIVTLALFFLPITSLYAEERRATENVGADKNVTGSVTAGFFSQYVYRGYELSADSMVIQPAITLSYYGFSLNLWGNLDTDQNQTQSFVPSDQGSSSWNETDLTLSYTYTTGRLSLTPGYIYYGPDFADHTQELFIAVGYDIITKPVLTVYQDIDQFPGTYIQLALSHSLPIYEKITLDLGSSFSYMWGQDDSWNTFQESTGDNTGSEYSAFHAGMVSAGVSITVYSTFVIQPVVQFWFPLSDDAKRTVDGNPYNSNGNLDNTFVFGINTTFAF